MPLSLRYIKILSAANIDWKELHLIDLVSLVYSLQIDTAQEWLHMEKTKADQKQGFQRRAATEADFNAL